MPANAAFPAAARFAVPALALLACFATVAATADTRPWPQRPIRIVAAQQAGSATDNLARLVADALETQLGVPVTVENRAGAGGKIGAEVAARATPDGYTVLVGGTSNLVIAAATEPELRYDPQKDFVAVGRFAQVPFGFAVHAAVPARTLGELVGLARAKPGTLTYVSLGPATSTGFGTRMLLKEAGIEMLAIEYKGIASAIPDLLAGRVDLILNEVGLLAQHSASGSVRALAIADIKRAARLPGVPTTAEQGFPRVTVVPWYGLLAPAGTPPDVQKRLVAAYDAAVRMPSVRSRIEALGYDLIVDGPGQFATALRDDIAAIRAIAAGGSKALPP
jgi:tripartite-type tricarboxylate transporter receptor subunit TctC